MISCVAALDLRIGDAFGEHRKRLGGLVSGLHFEPGPIDRAPVEPGRRPGLEAAEREAEMLERARQPDRGRLAHAPRGRLALADVNEAAQERAGGQYDRTRPEHASVGQPHRRDAALRENEVVRLALEHFESLGFADRLLHGCRIEFAVGLRARPAHRRALAAIEHAELDAAAIGHAAHQAVQRVDLAHQMAFAESSDRRIAGHRADGREPVGQERGAGAHACRGGRGFAARVAAADHDDVEILFHRRCSRRADVAKRSPGVKAGRSFPSPLDG